MNIPHDCRSIKIGVTMESEFSPWQRNYYEHIIRDNKHRPEPRKMGNGLPSLRCIQEFKRILNSH